MAVSQTLTLTEVANSANVANNTSQVRILWKSTQSGESWNGYERTAKYWVSINGGTEKEYTVSYTLPKNTTKTILDTTITVTHKDDGSGTVKVRTWMDTDISAGVVQKESSLTLSTIPRASTITSASNASVGSACSVKWTPKAASFRYKLKFEVGTWSYTTGVIHPNKTSEYTYSYEIPKAVANQLSNATGTMTVKLYSYSDGSASTQIGSTSSKTCTVTIPASMASTITTAGTVTLGNNCIVAWTPQATTFRYKLKFVLGSWSYTTGVIHPNITSSYTYKGYTIPWDVAKQMQSSTGTMTVYLYTYANSGATNQIGSASSKKFTVTMPAPTLTSAANVTLGNKCSVKWTPQATFFRYKLKFSVGSWSYTTGAIHPNITTAYTYSGYTIPMDVADHVTTKTGTMSVTLYAYSDSGTNNNVGTASAKKFTVTVPETDATRPTIAKMSVSSVSSLESPFNSLYIQGHSKVKAALTFGTKYNATVSASNITVDGKTYGSPYESDTLNKEGTFTVKATVKDSRGHYGTASKNITVIPYSKPYLKAKSGESNIVAARCDEAGNITDSGTCLKIKAKVVYSKVISNGTQYNYGKIKYRYRKEGGSYSSWQTILACETQNSDEVITAPLLNGTLDVKSNYQVQIKATDELFDAPYITIAVPSDSVYMDRPAGGKSMGLGGYSTGDGNLDIYWRTIARGGLSFLVSGSAIPLESTTPFPRDLLPSGFDPDNLASGIYIVSQPVSGILKDKAGNNIMYNGILVQVQATIGDSVRLQIALPIDTNINPMYRVKWYSSGWIDWRTLKL